MNIKGYVPILYTVIYPTYEYNGYVPFLILLYTPFPMNIKGYVPSFILLYTLPMNITGMSHSSYCYIPFLWTLRAMSHPSILLYTPTYEP